MLVTSKPAIEAQIYAKETPAHAPISSALVVSHEAPVPIDAVLPGEKDNSIDVEHAENVKEVGQTLGPIGDPAAHRFKRISVRRCPC